MSTDVQKKDSALTTINLNFWSYVRLWGKIKGIAPTSTQLQLLKTQQINCNHHLAMHGRTHMPAQYYRHPETEPFDPPIFKTHQTPTQLDETPYWLPTSNSYTIINSLCHGTHIIAPQYPLLNFVSCFLWLLVNASLAVAVVIAVSLSVGAWRGRGAAAEVWGLFQNHM